MVAVQLAQITRPGAPLVLAYTRNSKSLLLPIPSVQPRSEARPYTTLPESYRPLICPQLCRFLRAGAKVGYSFAYTFPGSKKCWNPAKSTFWLKEHKAKQIPEMASVASVSCVHVRVCRQTPCARTNETLNAINADNQRQRARLPPLCFRNVIHLNGKENKQEA